MVYDHYLLAPEHLQKEIEEVFSDEIELRGIKSVFYSPSQDVSNPENVLSMVRDLYCDNDVLFLYDSSCSRTPVPDEYSGSVKIKSLEHIYALFADRKLSQSYENDGAFIICSGWLEKWEYNLQNVHQQFTEKSFSETYSSILILDTGIHPDFLTAAEEMSGFTGVRFKVLDVGMGYFKLAFENLILRWDIEKKQNQLKVCNRKAASYAMSIDFIRSIADFTEESEAVASICKLFRIMFAPRNVLYYSFNGDETKLTYSDLSETDRKNALELKNSDANYLVLGDEDGFALKVSTKEDIFGVIELHNVAFPENLDEYLSVGYDLARASGLAISNIRRYYELFRSREEQARLTDMLRTTNRILRHDIANDLQIIMASLDLFEENRSDRYLSMIKKTSIKSASLIRDIRELDSLSAGCEELDILNVKDMIGNVTNKYTLEFKVNGNCLVWGDKALSSVFDNIISNAVRHGNASKVSIDIINVNSRCIISIADNGIGIPDEVKPRIFDEGFKHGDKGHTGFGLFIVRKTIERYNGCIWVEDNVPSGARFVIELDTAKLK
ncbi:ATP-binding protein [uncultured Methanolobus sp.]|uniref:ATP-binding protein n=1 Tax=uncultured Methanolobus sp. TaxID=218300 RepID=UPI002AAA6C75|nr:ATP-binding protein [uncultured Methanolobus sp.]